MKHTLEIIRRIVGFPVARLLLRGIVKAVVIVLAAGVLLTSFLVYWIYGPNFDLNFHIMGTADEFLKFALIAIVIVSIPVSLVTMILVATLLRFDGVKQQLSLKRSVMEGFVMGSVVGCIGLLIFGRNIVDTFLFIVVFVFTSPSGGIGALWMTKDALELF